MSGPITSIEPPRPPDASQGRRYLIVFGVVGLWMAIGIAGQLHTFAYLLVGIPLLLLFQVGIARRPITELWFKDPSRQPLPWWAYPILAALIASDLPGLIHEWPTSGWVRRGIGLAGLAGTVPLAYSIARFSRTALKPLLLGFATAGVIPFVILAAQRMAPPNAFSTGLQAAVVSPSWLAGWNSFLGALLMFFVVEEVFFRGGLDNFVQRPHDRGQWRSAAFVSALWGAWHLPIKIPLLLAGSHPASHLVVAANIVGWPLAACLVGIPLSLCWRRSGLLLVPALVHAFINAVPHVWSAS